MILYHGSNIEVREPQILESDRSLDFGTGFYLTSSLEQSQRWAELTLLRKGGREPIVSAFEIDEQSLNSLNVLRFDSATTQWLEFISANRNQIPLDHDFDIIIGPVANDRVMPTIALFYTEIIDAKETIKRLLPQKLKDQYTFKTQKSISLLQFKETINHG